MLWGQRERGVRKKWLANTVMGKRGSLKNIQLTTVDVCAMCDYIIGYICM